MGVRNSSLTRVAPFFDALIKCDETGTKWLQRLLNAPEDGARTAPTACGGPLEAWAWAPEERGLEPPKELLRWLIRHRDNRDDDAHLSNNPGKADLRRRLLAHDPTAIDEAMRLLEERGFVEHAWWVFEGRTYPDAFLQSPELVIVIEGKRTEAEATRHTTWMPVRDQMLRHLDCAWEIRGSRRVFGFMIVEGDEAGDPCAIPPAWSACAKEIMDGPVLIESLPHRTNEQRGELADCFLGVVTWQRLCREFSDFGISMDLLPDVCDG